MQPEFQFPKKRRKRKKRKKKKNTRSKSSFFGIVRRKKKIEKEFSVTQLIKLSTFEKVLLQCPGPRSKSVPATSALNAGVLLI